ncbi:MAG: cytochrome c biogenesis protein CcsA [Elusimicrobia bacterium]|nr:cytochrome c biogenesis protein CcsA [Elusimicrobiota bacterium]
MSRRGLPAWLLPGAGLLWALSPLFSARPAGLNARGLGELPVLNEGRLKPLDTVARASLLELSGRQEVEGPEGSLDADQWLLTVLSRPAQADGLAIFTVDDPGLLSMAGLSEGSKRRFSFKELRGALGPIERQAQAADSLDPARRTRFQSAALNLAARLNLYVRLKNSLWPEDQASMASALSRLARQAQDPKSAAGVVELLRQLVSSPAVFRPVMTGSCLPSGFIDAGSAAMRAASGAGPSESLLAWARLRDAAADDDAASFDAALSDYERGARKACPDQVSWARREALFNRFEPFYRGLGLYLVSLLALLAGWLLKREDLERAALRLAVLAFAVHSGGLIFRTVLQGRPPVTNLYSSAVFVGWVAVGAGLLLERRYKSGLATLGADVIGFSTLIIAHHLATQGDTVEMMRAVLDSNFWLSTHVVTITMGYGAGLLATALADVALLKMAWRRGAADAAAIDMIYALLCACLVLSFVGTVLGGIWADHSWGRFWGWDPKENGALLIVLWNAIALHARWGGYIRQKGLVVMAILGGVVISLAWFGVNMLGIGLHSYGFMDKAFYWLLAFGVSQAALMWLGMMPARFWKQEAA